MIDGKSQIQTLRNQVDDIDERIITLLKQRLAVTGEMGKIKSSLELPFRDEKREQEILQRLAALNQSALPVLPDHQLEDIFKTIMQWSLEGQ